jgi:hypothetical protein
MTLLTALRSRLTRRVGAAAASVALAGLSVAGVSAPAQAVDKLTHSQATAALSSSGISWSSSGGCSDRNNPTCTSFEQVNVATIQGIQTLKSASGCSINVTGGTETGHASGTYSHWNGYKLDISKYSCIGSYITNTFTYIGGSRWQSGAGNIYYDEVNHWDITYYNCGGC